MIDPKTVSDPALRAQLEALLAENATLKAKKSTARALTFRVGDKGALSVYHGSRFPVTLYAGQWENLLTAENVAAIKQALVDNKGKLKTRED